MRLSATPVPQFEFRQASLRKVVNFWRDVINSTNVPPRFATQSLTITYSPEFQGRELPLVTVCCAGDGDFSLQELMEIVADISDITLHYVPHGIVLVPIGERGAGQDSPPPQHDLVARMETLVRHRQYPAAISLFEKHSVFDPFSPAWPSLTHERTFSVLYCRALIQSATTEAAPTRRAVALRKADRALAQME